MWVPKAINSSASGAAPFAARINSVIENFKQCQPYGFKSVPVRGNTILFLPVGDGYYALGDIDSGKFQLNEGEVGLYSAGGARMILKNDGSVVINGRVFEKEGG